MAMGIERLNTIITNTVNTGFRNGRPPILRIKFTVLKPDHYTVVDDDRNHNSCGNL